MLLCSVFRRIPRTVFAKNNNFSIFSPVRPFLPLKNTRTYKKHLNKFVRGETVQDFKILDNVPDDFQLIYRCTMNKYLTAGQIVIIGTVGLVTLALCLFDVGNGQGSFEPWSPTARSNQDERYVYTSFLIIFGCIVQFVITKIPLRIYKHPKASTYTVIMPSNVPMSRTRFDFQRGQMLLPDESASLLPWKRNTYPIHKPTDIKSVIMFDQYFRRPADLSIMIGEQRDPDVDDDK